MGIVDFYSGYGSYHHNVVNKWIHIIGVPLILYTFNGMGEWLKIEVGGYSGNFQNNFYFLFNRENLEKAQCIFNKLWTQATESIFL